jgi:anti-anti-sigma factor
VIHDSSPVGEPDSPHGPVVVNLDDSSLGDDLAELRELIGRPCWGTSPPLIIDISGLSALSSSTLSALLFAQRRCRARGGWVLLRGSNRRCSDMLARTGLTPLFAKEPCDMPSRNTV